MRAVVFHGPGKLSVEEVPVPEPGPGEVLVEVDLALTCGTDLKAYQRGHRLFHPPMPFGHEFVGRIAALGPGTQAPPVGARVTAANSAPCRRCFYCKRRQTSLCDELDARLNWGAYAEYLRVPCHIVEQNLFAVPDGLPNEAAAALEPLACVVAGVDAAEVRTGDSVVVLGATGAIGLMFVQVLRQGGAGRVIAVGRSPERLALAGRLGADVLLGAHDGVFEDVRRATAGRGADVVIECTGQVEVWERAPDCARRGGTVVMFGGCPGGTRFSLDTGRVHYDALTIRGVFHHTPETGARAFELLARGRVLIEPLVGARVPLEMTEDALQRMARRELIKAAVLPKSGTP